MTVTFSSLFLAAAPPPASPLLGFVPMLLILVAFYFILIAPMRRRQRELQRLVDALEKGDRVVTSGGIHGEVAGLEGQVAILKIADQVKVRVSRSAITQVEEKGKKYQKD
jgi:preprotein translocase subunit YajC